MSNKAKNLIKKHFFYDMPHRGDYLSACKICHARARLIDGIQHKRSCEVGATIKELANSRVKNENGHRMSETAADYCDQLKRENAELRAANEALKVFISRQEAENAKLRSLVQQMREYLTPTCRGCAFANTSKCDNCRVAQMLEAAERGE